ncbi:MAG: DNA topoisomerase III, partial [Clostridia bacterium]|nr:DNA topoisomerase III [Clostridia bacterium]
SNEFIITWCVGHLITLSDPSVYDEKYKNWNYDDLPILPPNFKYQISKDKEKQFKVVKWLMNRKDVTEIVNGCDAGREGELIFRLVYMQAGCDKPFSRLWISSMEDSAIREGMANLKTRSEFDNLYYSALCRMWADWIVGINATRLFSLLYRKTLNIGRVQTPTLAMLTRRHDQISFFKEEKFYKVNVHIGGATASTDRINDETAANNILSSCRNYPVICNSVLSERKSVAVPKLFDLTSLQREANKVLGYTAKQTLDYAQSLYEKKLITYPRTDSRYLTDDMGETLSAVLHMAAKVPPFDNIPNFYPSTEQVINNKKVSDHHAIIPTKELEKTDLGTLTNGEKSLLLLIICRLLCAVYYPYTYESVTTEFECHGHKFTLKGTKVMSLGFKEIQNLIKSQKDEDEENDVLLSDFHQGQVFENCEMDVSEHHTKPPKPHTEATLLLEMEKAGVKDMSDDVERKGIGTPATRAAIIEKIVQTGFAERKGKNIVPTKNGNILISVLPETLTSADLTSEWENKLSLITKGELLYTEFMREIKQMISELVKKYPCITKEENRIFENDITR